MEMKNEKRMEYEGGRGGEKEKALLKNNLESDRET